MHSDSKRLFNNFATERTFLGCSVWRYFLIPSASAFSLAFEYIQKHTPSCIVNTFTKIFVFDHVFNVQIFYSKTIVVLNKRISNLMTKIKSLIRNLFVMFGNKNTSFFSTGRSFLSTRKQFLGFSKFSFRLFQILWRFNLLSIACSYKDIQSNINTYFLASFRKWINIIFNYERHIPFIISSGNRKGFYISINRSMPLNFYITNILKIKAVFFYLTAIVKSRIVYCIKSIRRFKSWIASLFTSLNSTKEGFKRFVKSPQSLLKRTIIAKRKILIAFSYFWQKICGLKDISNPFSGLFINLFSLSKGLIIKKTMSLKLRGHRDNLFSCGIKAIFENFKHLFSFL